MEFLDVIVFGMIAFVIPNVLAQIVLVCVGFVVGQTDQLQKTFSHHIISHQLASTTNSKLDIYRMFYVINSTMDSDSDVPPVPALATFTSAPQPSLGPASASGTPLATDEAAGSNEGDGAYVEMANARPGRASGPGVTTATEIIVIDDDFDGRGAVAIGPPTARRWDPMQYWMQRIGDRMGETISEARSHGNSIVWHLPPFRADPVEWCVGHIEEGLHEGYVAAFYVGVTHRVAERWLHPLYPERGHRRRGFHRMVICAVSDLSGEIGNAEIAVIARFRRWGRRGIMHNAHGHPLCENRNPGGEGVHHGSPPHCLYVVWKHNPRTG